jgi:hypothetical protein
MAAPGPREVPASPLLQRSDSKKDQAASLLAALKVGSGVASAPVPAVPAVDKAASVGLMAALNINK